MALKVAFSTEDGQKLMNDHFGEGRLFPVYEIDEQSARLIITIENTTSEEEMHGEARKAQEIGALMKPYGVQVLCGRQFGQNIVRMVKNFLPVLVSVDSVEQAIEVIQRNYQQVLAEWNKGQERKHLRLK